MLNVAEVTRLNCPPLLQTFQIKKKKKKKRDLALELLLEEDASFKGWYTNRSRTLKVEEIAISSGKSIAYALLLIFRMMR